MFIVGNLLLALSRVVDTLAFLYMWVIIIRALISWVNPDPYNPIVRVLYSITDPVLDIIRRRLHLYTIGIDISPIIAIVGIYFLRIFLVSTMFQLGIKLGGRI